VYCWEKRLRLRLFTNLSIVCLYSSFFFLYKNTHHLSHPQNQTTQAFKPSYRKTPSLPQRHTQKQTPESRDDPLIKPSSSLIPDIIHFISSPQAAAHDHRKDSLRAVDPGKGFGSVPNTRSPLCSAIPRTDSVLLC